MSDRKNTPPPTHRRGRFFPSLPGWLSRLLGGILIAAFWLGVWQLLAWRVGEELLLPTPAASLRRLWELAQTADFWLTLLTSLERTLMGILIGFVAGALLALLTHFLPPLYRLFYPLVTVMRATPVASFVILLFLWIGQDRLPISISVLMVLPVVWANLHEALGGVSEELLEMARAFHFSPLRRLRRVYLPSLRHAVVASCRSSVGLAWKAGISAEVLVVPICSIGRHLFESKLYLETTDLFAWTLAVVLLSLGLERLILAVLRLADHRRQSRRRQSHKRQTRGKEGASCAESRPI